MIVSAILLTKDNVYVSKGGSLPKRPSFDKELLRCLVKGQIISKEAAKMLPKSISKTACNITDLIEPEVGITIEEIDGLTDLLIIVRSPHCVEGKKFRLNKFRPIVKTKELEIWTRV